jgi:hypothetical protein
MNESCRGIEADRENFSERLDRSWVVEPTWQMPQPPNLPRVLNPAGSSPVSAGFSFWECEGPVRGLPMLTPERCRDRAAECQKMADQAPNARVRDILLDIGRTWTRLALEAEQWTQMNRPSARLTKAAPTNAPRVIKPTRLPLRNWRREPPT